MSRWNKLQGEGVHLARALAWGNRLGIPLVDVLRKPADQLVQTQRLEPMKPSRTAIHLTTRWPLRFRSSQENHETAAAELAEGMALSDVLERNLKYQFPASYLATIRQGEAQGQLGLALSLGLSQIERIGKVYTLLQSGLALAAIAIVQAGVVGLGVVFMLLPRYASIMEEMSEAGLPLAAELLILTGDFVASNSLVLLLLLATLTLGTIFLLRDPRYRWRLIYALKRVPMLGRIVENYLACEIATCMACALKRVDLAKAARVTATMVRDPFVQAPLIQFADDVEAGKPWPDSWEAHIHPRPFHGFLLHNGSARECPESGFQAVAEDAMQQAEASLRFLKQFDRVAEILILGPLVAWIAYGIFSMMLTMMKGAGAV